MSRRRTDDAKKFPFNDTFSFCFSNLNGFSNLNSNLKMSDV